MDRLLQKMGQETPKWPSKKLPPALLWTCSPLRGSLAFLLSPKSGLMGKNIPPEGGWHQAAFSLWEDAVCLHKAPSLGRAIGLVKAPTGNPRTGSLPHPLPES